MGPSGSGKTTLLNALAGQVCELATPCHTCLHPCIDFCLLTSFRARPSRKQSSYTRKAHTSKDRDPRLDTHQAGAGTEKSIVKPIVALIIPRYKQAALLKPDFKDLNKLCALLKSDFKSYASQTALWEVTTPDARSIAFSFHASRKEKSNAPGFVTHGMGAPACLIDPPPASCPPHLPHRSPAAPPLSSLAASQ
eukprot:1153032-Pelagomonas_calceolata.AAC.4